MTRGLGRGIEAFFPEMEEDTIKEIKLAELSVNPYQPRKNFSAQAIKELQQSIETHGVLQPLIVRQGKKGYEIVAGERRFRAAHKAGLKTVPVIVKSLTDEQMMEIALIENLQREDLNPVEEAEAYRKLMEELNYTQEELSKRVGKSRPHIANHVRLLNLPSNVLKHILSGRLSMGHGRALLGLKSKEMMAETVEETLNKNLNVRELEKLIQQRKANVPRETTSIKPKKNTFIRKNETELCERLGTIVEIKQQKEKGKIEIEFRSNDDLKRIVKLLKSE